MYKQTQAALVVFRGQCMPFAAMAEIPSSIERLFRDSMIASVMLFRCVLQLFSCKGCDAHGSDAL